MARRSIKPLLAETDDGQVMAETTIKYTAPLSLAQPPGANEDEITETDESELGPDEIEPEDIEEESEPATATGKQFVEQLRAAGVIPQTGYALNVAKFPPDSLESGPKAFKIACNRYIFTAKEILVDKAHIPRIKAYGPGRYWLTLRGPGSSLIMAQWEMNIDEDNNERNISPLATDAQPVQAQQILQALQAPIPSNPVDELERTFGLIERIEKLRRRDNPQQTVTAPAPLDPNLAVAKLLLETPSTAKQMAKNLLGGGAEAEGIWPMLIANAEPIAKAAEGFISLIFANIAAIKGGAALPQQMIEPGEMEQMPGQPIVNPSQQLAELLALPLSDDALSADLYSPSMYAKQIIDTADYASQNRLPSIDHYVEMMAKHEPQKSFAMIKMVTKLDITLTPQIETWLSDLRKELQTYYENEQSENSEPQA